MSEQELFIRTNEELMKVVEQITDDQWEMIAPKEMSWGGPKSVRYLINYHTYDDMCVPDVLAGKGKDEYPQFSDELDLIKDDPKGNYKKYAQAAIASVRDFNDLDNTAHLSYGDFPAREYLWHISTFRGLRCYDFAKLLGQNTKMADDMVQGLWDIIEPHAEDWRKMGIFGPKVDVEISSSLQEKLLALTGRAS